MRIKSIYIKNLRAIADTTCEVDDYCSFVGANGAGKSTFLFSLNVFFREVDGQGAAITSLSEEDFHNRNTKEPVEVTVWFDNLSDEALEDFKDYARQGVLVITAKAVWDEAKGRAEIKQYGQRLGMAEFAEYFRRKGDKTKVAELREVYQPLAVKFGLQMATTAVDMDKNLREFETMHPEDCVLIASEDQFYGASGGQGRLQRHIQWVYVPAVKDASAEQAEGKTTALGKLLARTVRAKVNFSEGLGKLATDARRQYQQLLDESQQALTEVSNSLNTKLAEWAHPEASLRLRWHQDSEKAVRVEDPFAKVVAGEGNFEGELARFGHGFQRSYLLALLQELASSDDGVGPKLLLGCEEPELYQHPPQAKHLAGVLQRLAETSAQVLVSTHSPLFVAGDTFRSVRLVRRDPATKAATVKGPSLRAISEQIARALGKAPELETATLSKISQLLQPQLAEMFFTQRLVLVEGLEDCAHIQSWLVLTGRIEEWRKRGLHLVPVNGKSYLLRPAAIAQDLGIPAYVVFDGDGNAKEEHKPAHERDNRALLRLLGGDESEVFPTEPVVTGSFAMWPTDLGASVDADLAASLGPERFVAIMNAARQQCGYPADANKHNMVIGAKLAYAVEAGGKSETLDRLCARLLTY